MESEQIYRPMNKSQVFTFSDVPLRIPKSHISCFVEMFAERPTHSLKIILNVYRIIVVIRVCLIQCNIFRHKVVRSMKINKDSLPIETKSHHLLVVDDDRINRELLMHLFERDYKVSTASGGREALDMLQETPDIDLVMLDIMMPLMSGLDVLGEIRESPATRDLPVILISAMANTRDVVNGLRLGANDYITKPVDVSVVVARVKTQLTVKRLLDERAETIVELEKAEMLRQQLFRIASHDLKTPLNNIKMAEHLLRKMLDSNKDSEQVLDTIKLTVESMSGIIANFLDMVELQSGEIDMKLKPVEFKDVIYNVLTQYEIAANKKNIELKMAETSGWVTADAARLVQVVSNLVSNAIKYSPSDTEITVTTETKDDMGRIYVADKGPGIPESERDKLFTEFGRLSSLPTGGESSTGLGLWIVKHLINAQNGTVGVEFPKTGGSKFWIALPVCEPPSTPSEFGIVDDTPVDEMATKNDDDTIPIRPDLPTRSDIESESG